MFKIVFLTLICGYIYHMIKTYQGFNRKQKILEEYHEFSMQVCWGSILICGDHRKEISGGFKLTTNNRMELLSVICALEALKTNGHDITIYSDSQYVVNSISKGWVFNWIRTNKKDAKNMDLWNRFVSLYKMNKITFVWVKGHADNELNNRCDVLATTASAQKNLPVDLGYGK